MDTQLDHVEWDTMNPDYSHSISVKQGDTSLLLRLPKPAGRQANHGHDLIDEKDTVRYNNLIAFLEAVKTRDELYNGDGYSFVYQHQTQRVMVIITNGSVPVIQHNSSCTYLNGVNTRRLFDGMRIALSLPERNPYTNL